MSLLNNTNRENSTRSTYSSREDTKIKDKSQTPFQLRNLLNNPMGQAHGEILHHLIATHYLGAHISARRMHHTNYKLPLSKPSNLAHAPPSSLNGDCSRIAIVQQLCNHAVHSILWDCCCHPACHYGFSQRSRAGMQYQRTLLRLKRMEYMQDKDTTLSLNRDSTRSVRYCQEHQLAIGSLESCRYSVS